MTEWNVARRVATSPVQMAIESARRSGGDTRLQGWWMKATRTSAFSIRVLAPTRRRRCQAGGRAGDAL
jgi:hypothetical protein